VASAAHRNTTRSEGTNHKAPTTSKNAKYHTVKRGETLTSIAESYNTSVAALKRDNPKLAANLRAGDIVVIYK
jgi:LysM repeat protein